MAELNVTFTPLYGIHGGGPISCLLRLHDFTILLDCGWAEPFDAAALQPLVDVLPSIDAGENSSLHAFHSTLAVRPNSTQEPRQFQNISSPRRSPPTSPPPTPCSAAVPS